MEMVRRADRLCWTDRRGAGRSSQAAPVRCSSSRSSPNDVSIPGSLDMSDVYSRLFINGSIRTLGAMVVSVVPALVLFRTAGPRMFFIGAAGGLVGGWQLHSADTVLKDPVKHQNMIPKAATVAECTEDFQREFLEAIGRRSTVGSVSKGISWVKDTFRFPRSNASPESPLTSLDPKSNEKQ